MSSPSVVHPQAGNDGIIVASSRQEGSPILQHIRECRVIFDNILPDYLVGRHHALLFITVTFHRLHGTDYIVSRMSSLKNYYKLRVLLCLVDVPEPGQSLHELTQLTFRMNFTLFLAWSVQEAGEIVQTFKVYENKSAPSFLLPKLTNLTPVQRAIGVLTSIPSVNRFDAEVLLKELKTIRGVLTAPIDRLVECPGIGVKKATAIREAVDGPLFGSVHE